MKSPGEIVSLQITVLCRDYGSYNSLLIQLQKLCEKPIQSDLSLLTAEEGRTARKLVNQEKILARWLEDVPSLAREFASELNKLQELRIQCRNLRDKGRSSLKTGLTLLDRERGRVKGSPVSKSFKKEAAPRLIDIEL